LSAQELRVAWRSLRCGDPTAGSSRDLMLREIAYKMQERAHGGLAPAIRRRLRALAAEIEANGTGALASAIFLKPGTRLLREWGGRNRQRGRACDRREKTEPELARRIAV
jgi:hypothetical protein